MIEAAHYKWTHLLTVSIIVFSGMPMFLAFFSVDGILEESPVSHVFVIIFKHNRLHAACIADMPQPQPAQATPYLPTGGGLTGVKGPHRGVIELHMVVYIGRVTPRNRESAR